MRLARSADPARAAGHRRRRGRARRRAGLHQSLDRPRPAGQAGAGARGRSPMLSAGLTPRLTAVWPRSSAAASPRLRHGHPAVARQRGRARAPRARSTSAPARCSCSTSPNRRARARSCTRSARPRRRPIDGVRLLALSVRTELAFVAHYLVARPGARACGRRSTSRRARRRRWRANPTYERAAAGEPAGRVLDAYCPAAGVQRLLVVARGRARRRSACCSTSRRSTAPRSRCHADRRRRARSSSTARSIRRRKPWPGERADRAPFTADPAAVAPVRLDADARHRGLDDAAPGAAQGGAPRPGSPADVGPLLHRLGRALAAEGVNVPDVVSLFSGETRRGARSPGRR